MNVQLVELIYKAILDSYNCYNSMGRKLLLEKAHVEGIRGYDVYRREGGYQSVEKAFKEMTPDQVTDEVKKSGLRGRGGAGFPAGMKWSFIAKPEGVPRHLVCNADESEPGTFKDRYLMEFLPHLLIEGLIVSSYALGSHVTYIYIRGEYAWIIDILETAIGEAKANGWLGKNILGTGFRPGNLCTSRCRRIYLWRRNGAAGKSGRQTRTTRASNPLSLR